MRKAYVFVIITALLFGTMEVSCKIGGNSLDPFQLTFLRFLIGGIVLLPFALKELRDKKVHITFRDAGMLAIVGFIGVTVSMSMFQFSIMLCNASTVSVLICVNPFFTMVFAHFMTAEKLDRYKLVVLAVAMAGIFFMLRPWDIQEGNSAPGMLLMIGAAFFFGLYTVMAKESQKKMGLMAQTSFSFIMGAGFLLVLMLIMGRPVLSGVTDNVPVILYTGILVTGLGYFCYFKAIALSDAATGSFAFFLKPAIAPVIAVIVLHETVLWNTVLGICIVLTASLLNIMYQKKKMNQRIAEAFLKEKQQVRTAFKDYEPTGERGYRHYAIMVPVMGKSLLYEVRSSRLKRQPGEICFPGGLIENGETPLQCALRETEEEVGIRAESIEIVSELDSLFTIGGSQMHCFLGIVRDGTRLCPNEEVEETFTMEMNRLMKEEPKVYTNTFRQEPDSEFPCAEVTGRKEYSWRSGRISFPVYDMKDDAGKSRTIWGLTGRITKQFVEILKDRVYNQ